MSVSPRRISVYHLADVLISAAMIVSAGACYNAPASAPQPVAGASGQSQQLAKARTSRSFPGADLVPIGRGAFVVRIHSGLVGDGEPLYVIDGAPMTISANTGIYWFKPEDIAQIQVLKRPDELTVYGPRGVNGVIVITTKQGRGI
jgi:TonB-dependent SusC/RagA subfamily outer membrane receptor